MHRYNFYGRSANRGWRIEDGRRVTAHPDEFMSEEVPFPNEIQAERHPWELARKWQMDVRFGEVGSEERSYAHYAGEGPVSD